jgi:hypothetical protein
LEVAALAQMINVGPSKGTVTTMSIAKAVKEGSFVEER